MMPISPMIRHDYDPYDHIPERVQTIAFGAICSAYHTFDELIRLVPPSERLREVRLPLVAPTFEAHASVGLFDGSIG
jgi:hypothetical protein